VATSCSGEYAGLADDLAKSRRVVGVRRNGAERVRVLVPRRDLVLEGACESSAVFRLELV